LRARDVTVAVEGDAARRDARRRLLARRRAALLVFGRRARPRHLHGGQGLLFDGGGLGGAGPRHDVAAAALTEDGGAAEVLPAAVRPLALFALEPDHDVPRAPPRSRGYCSGTGGGRNGREVRDASQKRWHKTLLRSVANRPDPAQVRPRTCWAA